MIRWWSPCVWLVPMTLPRLQRIEVAAGKKFLEVGMDEIAADEPTPLDVLTAHVSDGRAWTAVDGKEQPVGYILASRVDGLGHIDQVSVNPNLQGRGVGRALIDQVAAWAAAEHCRAVTLTTFSNVAWNRPLYEHLGFRVLEESEIGPELAATREHETALGLNPAIRVCMVREIAPAPPPGT